MYLGSLLVVVFDEVAAGELRLVAWRERKGGAGRNGGERRKPKFHEEPFFTFIFEFKIVS